ncbi:MAG TPA: hypothetical protein VGH32_11740, partial [Pirellulales bacterium]
MANDQTNRASTAVSEAVGRTPVNRRKLLTPTVWHGMTLGAWLRLVAENGCAISAGNWPVAAGITLAAA